MFYRVPAAFWVAFHGVCTAISVRLRDAFGVCTAFPWRSDTALTACRQSRYDVSIICLFALSAVPAYTCTQIYRKPARCLIDIKNGILTSASHLIIILFALSYLKSFYSSFLCFCHTC